MFEDSDISKIYCEEDLLFLNVFKEYWGIQLEIIGLGSHGHIEKAENHKCERFYDFPEVKSKSYSSQMKTE